MISSLESLVPDSRGGELGLLLQDAVQAVREENAPLGVEKAQAALRIDPQSGAAWHVLAVAREHSDDFTSALLAYENAVRLLPDQPAVGKDLGRLAYRMGMVEQAEKLFRSFLAADPRCLESANNLANVLRDQFRFAEAIAVAKEALQRAPEHATLWNTLGTIMAEQGDLERSIIFFEEALRIAPDYCKARYNRANSLLAKGQFKLAQLECEAALDHARLESEIVMMRLARANALLVGGELAEGWREYETRLSAHFSTPLQFLVAAERWTPEHDLRGKRVLIFGEQGLGDEILFASVLADVVTELGPEGRATLACEPRLQSLLARSFPAVNVVPHTTAKFNHIAVRSVTEIRTWDDIQLWVPIASLLQRFRCSLGSFPTAGGFLKADLQRRAHWREALAALPGRKVGIIWKSAITSTKRARYYARFEEWRPILAAPGTTFVNLQYGESAEELERARSEFGVDIWTPPGLDLRNDLEGLAALMSELDLVIGPATATTNLSAALGAPTWMLTYPGSWTQLGTPDYPWYPSARAFSLDTARGWGEVTGRVALALDGGLPTNR